MFTNTAVAVLPQPAAEFICLDIETGDAPPEAVAAAIADWKAPANVKDPEKIADSAQITRSQSLATPSSCRMVFRA